MLLPNKREETYTKFLTLLREAALQRDIKLAPGTVFFYFEHAAWCAFETVFPGSTLRGCFSITASVSGERYRDVDSQFATLKMRI